MDRDSVSIGRLGAPKGVWGDLKVHSHSGESAHFRKLKQVELRGAEGLAEGAPRAAAPSVLKLKVLRVEGEGSSLTIAFEGYPSPETARALTGLEIIVPRAAAAPLRPNEWYVDDLVGLSLVTAPGTEGAGAKLAVVRSILEGGAEPWLEAILEGGRSAIIPFRKEFVGEVDLAAGTIELLVPELLSDEVPEAEARPPKPSTRLASPPSRRDPRRDK
jgi:16S rRNA processing protein RimM